MSDPAQAAQAPEIPTFVECVIGYRTWKPDIHDQLWPVYSARRPWQPGTNTARCNCATWDSLRFEWSWRNGRRVLEPAPEHPAPEPGCVCGLYSWRRPSREWYQEPPSDSGRVVGAVASWGRMQVHADGFRAEHACIVTLAFHPGSRLDELAARERIAARYGVELVPLSDLEAAASQHGTPLPGSLMPSTERPMPREDPPAATTLESAPDARIEEVGPALPKVGFDGNPLPPSQRASFHR